MNIIEKKRIMIIICLLSFSLFMEGQQTAGYTKTRNYTVEQTYIDASSLVVNDTARSVRNIVYTDGFGRKQQEIQVDGSPLDKADLVFSYVYNTLGKLEKEYLPYAKSGNRGAFNMYTPDFGNIYGTEEQLYAFNQTEYEDSPLMRISRQTGAGKAWHTADKSIHTVYGMNEGNEIMRFKVSVDGGLSTSGYYEKSKLDTTIKTDEDGHQSKIYTDADGRIIMEISFNGEDSLKTYYVYDKRNRLRYVLPPEASHRLAEFDTIIDSSMLNSLAYYYEYDKRNHMISKRIPGCEPLYMVYDRRDRLVLSQDGNQRAANEKKWSYFVYDFHNRVVESGEILMQTKQERSVLQQLAWENENYLPAGNCTPLQYIVYDNYKPTKNVTPHPFVAAVGYDTLYAINPSGLVTSTKTRLLGTDGWMTETTYYDAHAHAIQTICSHPEKGLRFTHTAYDFMGNVLKLQNKIDTDILKTEYKYDERGRLLVKANTWKGQFSDQITFEYDAVGRLIGKNYGDMVAEKLSYNVRSWLTGIESPYFSQRLYYTEGVGVPCYNGNISSMKWHSGNENADELRGYKFTYDGLSRLKDAVYGEGDLLNNNLNCFNEQVTGYDRNGNILGLLRYGQIGKTEYSLVDNLNLVYDGNQLQSVNDNATNHAFGNGMEFNDGVTEIIEYKYDENGNLTKDLNKKIVDIQYNCLNLPEKIQFEDGNSISYLYAADGTKLSTTHIVGRDTTVTDYCGNAIYENGVLVKVLTEDGYITASDNQFHYFIHDHQGNNRVIVDQDGTVEEVNDYYPFGNVFSLDGDIQPYKYNGKELDKKHELNWYDYGMRNYDGSLGRWHTADPMAEYYYNYSPYIYCMNNPVSYVDPTGAFSTRFGAWLYKIFNGGDQILKDKGGEYFVSQQAEYIGEEGGVTVNRIFDWNGRNLGKILELERQWENYIADIEFQDLIETHGIEYIRTNSRLEAIANMLQPSLLTIMPNPLLKSVNGLTHSGNGISTRTVGMAQTPVGRSGNVMSSVAKNSPITIGGTKFTGHALDQMQARGIISPRTILDVVKHPGRTFPGNRPGTIVFIKDNLKVVTNSAGDIITVMWQ